MTNNKPLIDGEYLLEKFPGKGGWTFAAIPEIKPGQNTPFGWVRVRGSIDNYQLDKYKLMPMGNGSMFLPVKAAIRKVIKKEAGNMVHVKLWIDEIPEGIPDDLLACLEYEPVHILDRFKSMPKFEQNALIGWIYDAKTEDEKADRIVELIKKLE